MDNEPNVSEIFLDAPGHIVVVKLDDGKEYFYNMSEIIKIIPYYSPLKDEAVFDSGVLKGDSVVWENVGVSFGVLDIVNGGSELDLEE